MDHIGALGTDFRTASLRMRDALYLEKERVVEFIKSIPKNSPLKEVVALSTCNRIEIFYVTENHDVAVKWLKEYLATFHNIPHGMIDKVMKEYQCEKAVRHLFKVVSGLESMVFGEHEILGQVREAYFHCLKNDATDSYLNRLFQQAIATGKKVRHKTAAGRGALSIASIAVESMFEMSNDLSDKTILIIGTGTMGIRALKRLKGENSKKITLCNRTTERAIKFAHRFGTEYREFSAMEHAIAEHDIIFCATSYTGTYLITADMLQSIQGNSVSSQKIIIDVGAPRNADPQCASLPGITLVTVDDLKETAQRRLEERKSEMDQIYKIIEKQVQEFHRWYCYKRNNVCHLKKK